MTVRKAAKKSVSKGVSASYVPPMDPDLPFAFLITSFADSEKLRSVRREGIDPAVAAFGYPVYRIDEIPTDSPIVEATRRYISLADFVIADLSGARPNCYYEVGYAHALGRPVVHIISEGEQPAFNVAGLTVLSYRGGRSLRRKLQQYLLSHVLTSKGLASDEDENKGQFGRRQCVDRFIMTGRVEIADGDDDDVSLTFNINLRVRSVDPKRPLRGFVTFHLHETFDQTTYRVKAVDGIAHLTEIESYGSFTVGAVIHSTGTMLELDLGQLPGAGAEFRNR